MNWKRTNLLTAALLPFLFASCIDDDSRNRIKKLEADFKNDARNRDDSQNRIKKLETDFKNDSRNRIQKLEYDFKILEDITLNLQQPRCVLDPTRKGWASVETNVGRLLVRCDTEAAVQYLDGHKINLVIGNPLSMNCTGFKLAVRFGPRPPVYKAPDDGTDFSSKEFASWQSNYKSWEKSLKKQQFSFTETLPSGAWTKIDMVLSPSKPEEVGYIDLIMQIDQVVLRETEE